MKKREFIGHATVTDYLIAIGVKFHPETVILQVDDIDDPLPPIPYLDAIKGKCRPIFKYQAIEQILKIPNHPTLGRVVYVVSDIETHTASLTAFNAIEGLTATGENSMIANFTKDGYLCQDENLGEYIDVNSIGLELPWYVRQEIDNRNASEDAIFALMVFNVINEGYDIEEVEFPRNYRRRVQKKTGKTPSNHYRVRNIKRTRKRYQSSSNSAQAKRPEHLVRGHFRHVEDHPLEQFNGDWWIPAHTRGGESDKPKSKPIYRIEL
ncbi:hypothetical protein C8B47_03675 [filamentous cyanobacterium CCP4]|nr:hypothetical protein C8B47_03675 [filamentous cyanobacterium CCP4]